MATPRVSPPLTLARAHERLRLDPVTGFLYWRTGRKYQIGQRAGSVNARGYRQIKVDRVNYLEHRVIWFMSHGEWPLDLLDHEHHDIAGNDPAKLRQATTAQNAQNLVAPRGTNPYLGVRRAWGKGKKAGAWEARIKIDGVSKYLGRFQTSEAARDAYVAAKRQFHPFGTL